MARFSPCLLLFMATFACANSACITESVECTRAADCGPSSTICAGCPEEPDTHCRLGSCVAIEEKSLDIVGDLNLHRDIASQVASVVHVLAHPEGADEALTCENVWETGPDHLADRVNVLASGYKSLSGGSYHPDISFGRSSDDSVVLLVIATTEIAGEGEVVAKGCDLDFGSGSILNVDP